MADASSIPLASASTAVPATATTAAAAAAAAAALASVASAVPLPSSVARFSVSPTISFLGYLIALVYRIAFWLLALVTYRIPSWTIAILSWGGVISLEFNAVKLFLLFVGLSIVINWTIKARYLNKYSKLREPPLRTDEKLDLHPDVAADPSSGGINNYLDEFRELVRLEIILLRWTD
jgi:hypothetical protein